VRGGDARVALNQNTLFKTYYSRSNCERDKTRIRLLIKQRHARVRARNRRRTAESVLFSFARYLRGLRNRPALLITVVVDFRAPRERKRDYYGRSGV